MAAGSLGVPWGNCLKRVGSDLSERNKTLIVRKTLESLKSDNREEDYAFINEVMGAGTYPLQKYVERV